MRTKLTLWRNLDKYFDEYFISGMCGYINRLYNNNILTCKEEVSLRKEIRSLYPNRESGYYVGPPGDKEPRKKLIRNRIEYYVYMYVLYLFSGIAIVVGYVAILLDSYTDIDLSFVYGILLFLYVFAIIGIVYLNKITKIIIKLWNI